MTDATTVYPVRHGTLSEMDLMDLLRETEVAQASKTRRPPWLVAAMG